jgi:hypothetical protein
MASGRRRLVGRWDEMQVAFDLMTDARAGCGRILAIGGEPGVGKTRLAEAIADAVRQSGGTVVWGQCWEPGGAPPLWPWRQALREAITRLGADALQELREKDVRLLTNLVFDGDSARDDVTVGQSSFFSLYVAVGRLLDALSHRTNTCIAIVLEDVHAGDELTLRLTSFVASSLIENRVLLLVTYRNTDLAPGGFAARTLTELMRRPGTASINLEGLDVAASADVFAALSGTTLDDHAAQVLYERTQGNPLYVSELAKLSLTDPASTTSTSTLPAPMSDVLLERVRRLTSDTQEVLSVAATLGDHFDPSLLSLMVPAIDTATAVDEALSTGILRGSQDARSFRFHHDLIREAVYRQLPTRRRRRLHLEAAHALERQRPSLTGDEVAVVAHHYVLAADEADPQATVRACVAASARARRQLAFDEAARMSAAAINALERRSDPDPMQRLRLEFDLADALMRAGRTAAARDAYGRAADLARAGKLPGEFAAAAIGYGGRTVWTALRDDARFAPLLEEALDALDARPSPMRSRVLARLAGGPMRDLLDPEARRTTSAQALEMARAVGTTSDVLWALIGRWAAINQPGNAGERIALADEIIDLGTRSHDHQSVVQGRHMSAVANLEAGRVAQARTQVAALRSLAAQRREPTGIWLGLSLQTTLLLLDGDLLGAEKHAYEALSAGAAAEPWNAQTSFRRQLYFVLRELGRAHEVEPALRDGAQSVPALRATHAALLAAVGEHAEAASIWERISRLRFDDLPRDEEFLYTLTLLADAVVQLEDADAAQSLINLLEPYADLIVLGHPDVVVGSVHHSLGSLSALLGRWVEADAHFTAAGQIHEQIGAPLLTARTRLAHAAVLQRLDRTRATVLSRQGLAVAHRYGAIGIATGSSSKQQTSLASAQQSVEGRPPSEEWLIREGEYWSISHGQKVVRIRDSKGVRLLAFLMTNPNQRYSALDLERLDQQGDPTTTRAVAQQRELELLDDEARRAYRDRLAEIDGEEAAACKSGDAERARLLREERTFLARELSRATALGGTPRQGGSVRERARLNVTRAVRSAIGRLAEFDSGLGDHLQSSIQTGAFCSYAAPTDTAVSWRVVTRSA